MKRNNISDSGYQIPVLYEDNHIIAVNKPAGVLVQADKTGDKPLIDIIKDHIKIRDHKPGGVFLGCVHRLDRPVSGVILFAKTSKMLDRLNKLFKNRNIEKTYWAIVKKRPQRPKGHLAHYLIKNPENNTVAAYEQAVPGGLFSELDYLLLKQGDHGFLLEVSPRTGRPHQIRVQLASMGCSIRGDKKYGAPKGNSDGSINLHAARIAFNHPVRHQPLEIKARPPETAVWQQLDDWVNQIPPVGS